MLDKINKWIPLLILIVVVVILYFVFSNKKDTESQSDLLLAMAEKLKVQPEEEATSSKSQVSSSKSHEQPEPTDEEKEEILRIADTLCFRNNLNAEDQKFYKKFKVQIDEELKNSAKILSIVIDKFLSGSQDFADYEKKFYELNKKDIDCIVQYEKLLSSITKKLTEGTQDFTEAELEFQQNYPKELEAELNRIKKSTTAAPSSISHLPSTIPAKGANPPLAQGERLKIILDLFNDGIPKTITQVATLYAEKTGTSVSRGNMHGIFGKLEGKNLLYQDILLNSRWQVFYGLPEWFDGKKFKKEYKQKIV